MEKEVKPPVSDPSRPLPTPRCSVRSPTPERHAGLAVPLQELIAGVQVKEVKNVIKDNGYLTEIWREDWPLRRRRSGRCSRR